MLILPKLLACALCCAAVLSAKPVTVDEANSLSLSVHRNLAAFSEGSVLAEMEEAPPVPDPYRALVAEITAPASMRETPESPSLMLIGLGLILLAILRRQRGGRLRGPRELHQ